ncbi:MAG TPA: helix-turn-helix transcriptional regulator [Mycobacteriales bacterium]|nr:helix-turn-helix transcriptional regulator [Mycobacteriales bacterium]
MSSVHEAQRRSIGSVVKVLRQAAGLSRAELALRTADGAAQRVGLEMLAKVEQGRKAPSPATAAKLARALGISPNDLARSAARWESGAAVGVQDAALRLELLAVVRVAPPPAPAVTSEDAPEVVEPRGRRADLVRQLEAAVRALTTRGTVDQLENAVLALQAQATPAATRLASIDIGGATG